MCSGTTALPDQFNMKKSMAASAGSSLRILAYYVRYASGGVKQVALEAKIWQYGATFLSVLPDRLVVGRLVLAQVTEVRILVGQLN